MEEFFIKRVYLQTETLGSLYTNRGVLVCKTMELQWKDNQRSISCIPEGRYYVTKEKPIPKDDPNTPEDESGGRKPRDYGHFRIHGVPKRSGILVHKITYVKDLEGCIGCGGRFVDWNNDGVPDMADSGSKLEWMYNNLPDEFYLNIAEK